MPKPTTAPHRHLRLLPTPKPSLHARCLGLDWQSVYDAKCREHWAWLKSLGLDPHTSSVYDRIRRVK